MKKIEYGHTPVLLNEVLQGLNIRTDGCYVDCTFGRGGHSRAILQSLGAQGRLFAIDKDPEAIATLATQLKDDGRFVLLQGSYTMLSKMIEDYKKMHQVHGVLFDLGISSPQLDDSLRGFSFGKDGPLDMRMDDCTGTTAAEWLGRATELAIEEVLRQYGEERYAKKIARAIVKYRKDNPLLRTGQLADLISKTAPSREKHKHPATRTFQAIRIFLNRELEELSEALEQALEVLATGGRLVVISFHSLEDRVVKRFLREMARGDQYPPGLPVPDIMLNPRMRLIGKAVYPSASEVRSNPRARSAVLRVAEKII